MFMRGFGHVSGVSCRGQRASDTLELELQVLVSCPIRVLGTKLRSPAGAVSTLNHESSLQPQSLGFSQLFDILDIDILLNV